MCDFGYIIARGNATLEDSYLYQLTKSKKTLRYIPMMRSIMVHNRAFVCALAYDTSNFFKVAKLCDAFNNDFNFILDGSIKRIRQDPEQDFNSVLNNYFFNMRNRIDFFGYITFAKSHQYISHLLLLDFNCGFTFYVDKVDRLEAYSQGFTDLSDSFLEEENADFIDYMYSEATNYISVYDTIALLDVFSKTSDLIKIQESLTYDYNISTECIALQYNKHMYMLSKVMEYLYLYFYYEMEVHSRYASDLIDSYIDNDPKLHYLIALIDIVYEYSEDQ